MCGTGLEPRSTNCPPNSNVLYIACLMRCTPFCGTSLVIQPTWFIKLQWFWLSLKDKGWTNELEGKINSGYRTNMKQPMWHHWNGRDVQVSGQGYCNHDNVVNNSEKLDSSISRYEYLMVSFFFWGGSMQVECCYQSALKSFITFTKKEYYRIVDKQYAIQIRKGNWIMFYKNWKRKGGRYKTRSECFIGERNYMKKRTNRVQKNIWSIV